FFFRSFSFFLTILSLKIFLYPIFIVSFILFLLLLLSLLLFSLLLFFYTIMVVIRNSFTKRIKNDFRNIQRDRKRRQLGSWIVSKICVFTCQELPVRLHR